MVGNRRSPVNRSRWPANRQAADEHRQDCKDAECIYCRTPAEWDAWVDEQTRDYLERVRWGQYPDDGFAAWLREML
jgi:hypothetical protein